MSEYEFQYKAHVFQRVSHAIVIAHRGVEHGLPMDVIANSSNLFATMQEESLDTSHRVAVPDTFDEPTLDAYFTTAFLAYKNSVHSIPSSRRMLHILRLAEFFDSTPQFYKTLDDCHARDLNPADSERDLDLLEMIALDMADKVPKTYERMLAVFAANLLDYSKYPAFHQAVEAIPRSDIWRILASHAFVPTHAIDMYTRKRKLHTMADEFVACTEDVCMRYKNSGVLRKKSSVNVSVSTTQPDEYFVEPESHRGAYPDAMNVRLAFFDTDGAVDEEIPLFSSNAWSHGSLGWSFRPEKGVRDFAAVGLVPKLRYDYFESEIYHWNLIGNHW